MDTYLQFLENRRVGLLCNHSARIAQRHLLDTLLTLGINVTAILSPEHGFDGKAQAGALVENSTAYDSIRIFSLYGKTRRPTSEMLNQVDIILYDLQDVGVRCYTYISTLQYLIQEALTHNPPIPIIILDRPNPNGHFVDGPVLKERADWFVGMHPIPWVHGLTVGELTLMIIGERWVDPPLDTSIQDLFDEGLIRIIPCENYTHATRYAPPLPPSPNLPNIQSILLYPTLALFEGTRLSVGRGTSHPFQIVGDHRICPKRYPFHFTPNQQPELPHHNKTCYGLDLTSIPPDSLWDKPGIRWEILTDLIHAAQHPEKMFQSHFDRLLGAPGLKKAILRDKTIPVAFHKQWQQDLDAYRLLRAKYLLYVDAPAETERLQKLIQTRNQAQ